VKKRHAIGPAAYCYDESMIFFYTIGVKYVLNV
jgi:hypothetical protein